MKKQKKKKQRRRLLIILIVQLVLIVGLLIGLKLAGFFPNVYNEDDDLIEPVEVIEGYRNIVIFGVDSRENRLERSTHSDTIMVVSINQKTKDIKLLSIFRDTYVDIPEYGYNKINAAYFRGGYSTAINTINKNFDLDITEYVTVNFSALINAIDRLGGIELDIQSNELKYLNGYVRELNRINGTEVPGLKQAGTQLVNGTQATAYARIRYTAGSDFKRTERQRVVISKMFDKAKASDPITIGAIARDIFPQTLTNLSLAEILILSKDIFAYNIVDETGFPFERDARTYKKVSYVFPVDLAANVTKMHEFLFETEEYVPSERVQEISNHIKSILN